MIDFLNWFEYTIGDIAFNHNTISITWSICNWEGGGEEGLWDIYG